MTPHALLFTLAAIGISETFYLIRKRIAFEKPVCPLGESCEVVLKSKYNRLFGIHNDVLGFLFYVGMTFVAALVVIGVEPVTKWIFLGKLAVSGGVLMSLFFLYLQWRVIKAWCFWCVMSSITIFSMFAIIFISDLTIIFR